MICLTPGRRVQVSELLRSAETACEVGEERVDSTLAAKEKRLMEILQKADDLRLRTLKGVLEILTPIQAVHFLIAAAELHSRLTGARRRTTEHTATTTEKDDTSL
ncbi:hypothetical protein Peur_012778 [Populus x canadensis]